MKQSYIEHMKNYRTKQKQVKAVKYQEGMEDGWMIILPDLSGVDDFIDRLFETKADAVAYKETIAFNENEIEIIKIVPVLLTEVTEEEIIDNNELVTIDGVHYSFDELTKDIWIVMEEEYDFPLLYEYFDDYEEVGDKVGSVEAEIGFDEDIEELYLQINDVRVSLDKTEIATVEKLLTEFEISFTERIGRAFVM